MRFPPKIFLIILALTVTLTIPRSAELKIESAVDVKVKGRSLLERTPGSTRKNGGIDEPDQEMNVEQRKEKDTEDEAQARFTPVEIAVTDLDHVAWQSARPLIIGHYWSGEAAPLERQTEARLLWSEKALSVRFVYRQTEPMVTSARPQTKRKTIGLWERDVCEIFITPNVSQPERYFEFEAAPTGEWLDLRIHYKPEERETDWKFHSGMTAAARVTPDKVTIALSVPWKAFARKPRDGERWRGNLFRASGSGETRGYFTWRPTRTPEPNFHLPTAFGWIRFERQNLGVRIQNPE
jgi:Carbohydrate-binding family 9